MERLSILASLFNMAGPDVIIILVVVPLLFFGGIAGAVALGIRLAGRGKKPEPMEQSRSQISPPPQPEK